MAFTYSGDPSKSPLDAVRFFIGDTDPCDVLLQNGEINYVLAKYNNAPVNASIECVQAIMSKLSRVSDEKVGQVDIKFSQRMEMYGKMLVNLRHQLAVGDIQPFAGGISATQKQANLADTDTVRPDFTKQMMINDQNSSLIPQSEHPGGDPEGE